MTRSRQTADWGSRAGLAKIVPSSVAVGSGTGSSDSLGNVTFSGASSVSLNGCFSSTYDNYRITFQPTALAGIADADLHFYGRASGVNTTTNMASERIMQYSTSIAGTEVGSGRFAIISSNYAEFSQYVIDMKCPFLSRRTVWNSAGAYVTNVGVPYQTLFMGYVDLSTSFDGFTVYPGAGTISGTIRVYGYTQ